MRTVQNWVMTAVLATGMGLSAAATANEDMRGKQVRDEWSGWWNTTLESDVDGDMQGGSHADVAGSGSNGRFIVGAASDLAPWDEVSFCEFDSDGNPIAVPLQYVSLFNVARYENGDLLYTQLSSSPPSELCFNFLDNTFTFEAYVDFIGGTGRFENASGQMAITGGGTDFVVGFGSQYGKNRGVIYGVRAGRHDKPQDDD